MVLHITWLETFAYKMSLNIASLIMIFHQDNVVHAPKIIAIYNYYS